MSTRIEGSRSLVITQPMLMPWHGLFSQIKLADETVIYDDVQLPLGRSFITRVQINTANGLDWLTVPVQRAGQGKQRICDAVVLGDNWKGVHLARIKHEYRHAPFFTEVMERVVLPIYLNKSQWLVDFLIDSVALIAAALKIPVPFVRSSQFGLPHVLAGNERLLAICKARAATNYITGHGGMNYLAHEEFDRRGVRVHYMDYTLAQYRQLHGRFSPYVSIIDLLFNVGPEHAQSHLRSKPVYWREWPHQVDGRPVPSLTASH